jgi:benzoylformate decarboxylase/acetolactate synthase-1/2/3 large subunit
MTAERRYGSDLMVDLLVEGGIEHVALNPGASFRGLHDSLVQREDAPEMILCTHEKVAVGVAHGYAKAAGKPMGAILHNVVGLLQGSMGLFYAYTDRAPVLVLGGAGPMDTHHRRPEIDWKHTANIQGNAIRDFVKWDDQPSSVEALADSIHRARRIAVTEPAGPTYVALDADLQEQPMASEPMRPAPERLGPASPIAPDPRALDTAARWLLASERPILLCGYAGRDPEAFRQIPELADLVGAGIVDTGVRLNAPNRHPLNVTGAKALEDADLVVALDMKDLSKWTRSADTIARVSRRRLAEGARVVDIGFGDLHANAWIHHHGPIEEIDLRILADTTVALPLLIERCRELLATGEGVDRGAWRARLVELGEATRAAWRATAERRADERPVAPARLVAAVWEAIREHDWVLTAGTADWAPRLWDFDRPYRHPGGSLGTATQIGISLGVSLAHRDTERLVVDIQPDGDLLYDPGALWTAAAHRLPLLVVMFNNRAYYNDWNHQIDVANDRGRSLERVDHGVGIIEPPTDFAAMARSMGWQASGPITDPDAIEGAVRTAAAYVLEHRRPALVDVVCAHR